MKNKRIINIVASVILLLLIPLIAMQFTEEVNWTVFDFLIAAILLLSSALTVDYVLRKVKRPGFRIALSVAILAMLILIWAELAVGILGTPLGGQ